MLIPIQIRNRTQHLMAMLHIPLCRKTGDPLLVINYGLNGDRVDNHRMAVDFANEAAAQGITVLRFDYAGCGLSSGEFWETSLQTKASDTHAVIDFAKNCFEEEDVPVILLGYSDGIRVIHKIIQERKDILAFCAWNPIIRSMSGTFKSKKKMTLEPTTKKLAIPLFGVYMGMDYLKEANEDLALDDLLSNPQPKLFAFGSGDNYTLQVQEEIKKASGQRTDFDLVEIADANHLFNRETWCRELTEKTLSWLNRIRTKNIQR